MSKNIKPGQREQGSGSTPIVSDQRSITVYSRGFAVVQEWRRYALQAGSNKLTLDGIAPSYKINSLLLPHVLGAGVLKYTDRSYLPANCDRESLLTRAMAEQCEVTVRLGTGGRQSVFCGKILSVSQNQVNVQTKNGIRFCQPTDDIELKLQPNPREMRQSPLVQIDLEASVAGNYEMKLFYIIENFVCTGQHTAICDLSSGVIKELRFEAAIENNAGAGFPNAEFKLFASDINLDQAMQPYSESFGGAAVRSVSQSSGSSLDSSSVLKAGENDIYKMDRRASLRENEKRLMHLFTAVNVPYKQEYFVPAVDRFRRGGDDSLQPVMIGLHIVNDAKSGLGRSLIPGPVKFLASDGQGSEEFTAACRIDNYVNEGEDFTLETGTTSAIKACRRVLSAYEVDVPQLNAILAKKPAVDAAGTSAVPGNAAKPPADDGQTSNAEVEPSDQKDATDKEKRRYRIEPREVSVHNYKADEAVPVNVYDSFPDNSIVHELSAHKFEGKATSKRVCPLSVPAGGTTVLSYLVITPVR